MTEVRKRAIPLEPTWAAHNNKASALVDYILSQIEGLVDKPSSQAKYRTVVSSILATSVSVLDKPDGLLATSKSSKFYTGYEVSLKPIQLILQGMEANGWLTFLEGSGKFYLFKDNDNKTKRYGLLSLYDVNENLLQLAGYFEAAWVEVGKPPVLVSVKEAEGTRIMRKREGRAKPKLTITETKKKFRQQYSKSVNGVKFLGTQWQKHPLALPPKDNQVPRFAASATRVYHDGRLDSGGRYYSSWTGMKGNQRLLCRIDDEPVVQIDLNASQPTLFSSLMGEHMEVGSTWTDLYQEIITSVADFGSKDDFATKRRKIKQAAVEVIGTGNPNKTHPSPDTKIKWQDDVSNGMLISEWSLYVSALLHHVPALRFLKSDYMKGSGFISFSEAEIMQLTLTTLAEEGVTAYPVHDCLLVKKSDQDVAVQTYRETVRGFIISYNKSRQTKLVDITVPVSIEEAGKNKLKLEGCYH